jgi:hypothetical protein
MRNLSLDREGTLFLQQLFKCQIEICCFMSPAFGLISCLMTATVSSILFAEEPSYGDAYNVGSLRIM